MESRTLVVPGRGDRIQAIAGFRMFATRTCRGKMGNVVHTPVAIESILSNLWQRIQIEPLSYAELAIITKHRFACLSSAPQIIDRIVEAFRVLCEQFEFSDFATLEKRDSLTNQEEKEKDGVLKRGNANIEKISFARALTARKHPCTNLYKYIYLLYLLIII